MICPRCAREIPDDAALCCYCGRTIVPKRPSRSHQRANGSGTAVKRGKTWRAIVTVGWTIDEKGKKVQIRRTKDGFKTKDKALAYCPQLMAMPEKKKVPSLQHYWDMYYSGEYEKLGKSKQCAYKIAWNRMKPLASRPIDTLTVADLRKIVNDTTSTYYPAHDMKVLLNHLFYLGAADRHVAADLPSFIILPELNETERVPFTVEEQKSFWAVYESGVRDAAIPLIMIYTGMMTGEMRDLTVEMIHFDSRRIIGVGLKTEHRKAADVYLPNDILPVIQDVIDYMPAAGAEPVQQERNELGQFTSTATDPVYDPDSPKEGRLFPWSEDEFYSRYYAVLEKAGARRLTPYSCRHTTATALAIDKNIAPETVRKVMRWTTTAMLPRYAHPADADALEAVDALKRPET